MMNKQEIGVKSSLLTIFACQSKNIFLIIHACHLCEIFFDKNTKFSYYKFKFIQEHVARLLPNVILFDKHEWLLNLAEVSNSKRQLLFMISLKRFSLKTALLNIHWTLTKSEGELQTRDMHVLAHSIQTAGQKKRFSKSDVLSVKYVVKNIHLVIIILQIMKIEGTSHNEYVTFVSFHLTLEQ